MIEDAEERVLDLAALDQLPTRSISTVLEGIEKPTPSFPPESLSICALTPITWPWSS